MIEELIKMMERNGVVFMNRDEAISMMKYSFDNGWIKSLKDKEGKRVGFLSYMIENTTSGKHLVINDICILKGKENSFKLFSLRRIFKDEIGNIQYCGWRNNKRDQEKKFIPIGE